MNQFRSQFKVLHQIIDGDCLNIVAWSEMFEEIDHEYEDEFFLPIYEFELHINDAGILYQIDLEKHTTREDLKCDFKINVYKKSNTGLN